VKLTFLKLGSTAVNVCRFSFVEKTDGFWVGGKKVNHILRGGHGDKKGMQRKGKKFWVGKEVPGAQNSSGGKKDKGERRV